MRHEALFTLSLDGQVGTHRLTRSCRVHDALVVIQTASGGVDGSGFLAFGGVKGAQQAT